LLSDLGSNFGRYLREYRTYILAEEYFALASAEVQSKVIPKDLGIVVEQKMCGTHPCYANGGETGSFFHDRSYMPIETFELA
jgi:hypothetical protein